MTTTLTPAHIALLAQASRLRFPDEDLSPLAEALAAHLEFVGPLLEAEPPAPWQLQRPVPTRRRSLRRNPCRT